jgi:hypothetical protein
MGNKPRITIEPAAERGFMVLEGDMVVACLTWPEEVATWIEERLQQVQPRPDRGEAALDDLPSIAKDRPKQPAGIVRALFTGHPK